ncbi:MAG: permease [Candidatus Eisenbacteria bacterium]|nr:permease [Candidatus Eisenbacteria bacterium]
MRWKKERGALLLMTGGFLAAYFFPAEALERALPLPHFLFEAFHLVRWYAREHVLLCLVPAFFIAGAISVFLSQASVMKYLGAGANKIVAYGVASVSGTILAVCSCTVLPLFAGIHRMGAGLGPATAFLYSGPAINVLAIVLTARVLGLEMGIARAAGAILFSVVIGVLMHLLFLREEKEKAAAAAAMPAPEEGRPLHQTALLFASLVGILVFANWGAPRGDGGVWAAIYFAKWFLTAGCAAALGVMLGTWFGVRRAWLVAAAATTGALAFLFRETPVIPFAAGALALSVLTARGRGEASEWFGSAWGFAKQILPLLLLGVLVAGALLGRPNEEGLIPSRWIASLVGGNSLGANLFASAAGAFMYFATLTEVPILQGLLGAGMGKGPALALLLAGPALSLPNMLVIRSVIGTRKTIAFVILVIVMATVSGMIFGAFTE